MNTRTVAVSNGFAVLVAAVAWCALSLQYRMSLWSGDWAEATVRFFSFFTILSNLLVALVATASATGGNAFFIRVWRGPGVRGLAALSISVTFLIYATLLQSLWQPHGAQLIADRLLHYVVPFLYMAWWLGWLPHGQLAWSHALRWLGFPLAFLAWTLVHGAIVGHYPYFFLDVARFGYASVLLNSAMVGCLFLLLGLAYVAIDRVLGKRAARIASTGTPP